MINGIEKITRRIEEDVQAQIRAVLEKADREAKEIAERYEAQAAQERETLRARHQKDALERQERLVSAAQMESRKAALAMKQEMVEKAYEAALEKLCSLPQETYIKILADLMGKASADGKEAAVFSEKDRLEIGAAAVERANAVYGKNLTLAEETAPIRGGVILKGQRIEVNCAFETLIRLQKGETAGAVAKVLFPQA